MKKETEKALKKTDSKSNRQNGIKFYWKAEQNPDEYSVYRKDINNSERRLPEEICQQELKNAVCYTLEMNKVLYAEELTKETIRNMGFSRSGSALMEAVTRGLKYGLKTGELIKNEDKTIQLNQDI